MTDNLIEAIARAMCEQHIREVRRWDTEPGDLEKMMPECVGYSWADFADRASIALRAISDAGYVIVPKHPGKEILDAMADADPRERNQDFDHEKYLAAINAGKPRA